MGSPQRCTRPVPAVTIRIWPSGWVCHAVRAPASNVTGDPDARAGTFAWNRGSTRTEPVKFSACPCREGCEPLRAILIACESWADAEVATASFVWADAEARRESVIAVATSSFISVLSIMFI